MSVLFHIATARDWERAANTGTYATESLRRDGVIGCSLAAQHAAVANHRFAGRTDLVLLLIDTDRLQSGVHIEQAEADGQPIPRVHGPVNLDAVFEAAPYRPGADGRFHPHEEASGFATHGVATLDQTRRRALEVMAGYRRPWWVAGGWALDLLLGAKTRPHADLEISMLAADQPALFRHLRGWDLRLAAPGRSLLGWDGSWIQPPFHQVWARRGPGGSSTAEEFAADPTMLGFLLEQHAGNRWVFRRHPAVSRPLHQVGGRATDGVPVVAPEIALLFKAKTPRYKDQRDFDRALPYLDRAARSWLASALKQAHPGHPWQARVTGGAGMTIVRDYDFHPPGDLRLFPMPEPGILRLDDRAFVAVVRYGDIVVWHYAFADHWFKINATTDLQGRLVETTAPGDVPPFTFNCDIATPMRRHGDAVFAVDLFMDVLVRSDGITHRVYDHEEFDQAIREGWLSDREAAGARAEVEELTDLIERDALLGFLAAAHPFGRTAAPAAPAMRSVPLREVPLLQPGVRPSW